MRVGHWEEREWKDKGGRMNGGRGLRRKGRGKR